MQHMHLKPSGDIWGQAQPASQPEGSCRQHTALCRPTALCSDMLKRCRSPQGLEQACVHRDINLTSCWLNQVTDINALNATLSIHSMQHCQLLAERPSRVGHLNSRGLARTDCLLIRLAPWADKHKTYVHCSQRSDGS
jgi:hypothetical protein